MRVKVKKLSISTNKEIVNNDMNEYFTVGDEYIVYALTFTEQTAYIQIFHEQHLISVPIGLFEIIDNRLSKFWIISMDNNNVKLWPKKFYIDFFHDDLFERVPKIVNIFEKIKKMIDEEWGAKGYSAH